MITISKEALSIIEEKDKPLFLDMPKAITGCCFDIQECPSVRFGEPHNISDYKKSIIQDVTVYIPKRLPDVSLEIKVSKFLGIKRLVLEGWCLI